MLHSVICFVFFFMYAYTSLQLILCHLYIRHTDRDIPKLLIFFYILKDEVSGSIDMFCLFLMGAEHTYMLYNILKVVELHVFSYISILNIEFISIKRYQVYIKPWFLTDYVNLFIKLSILLDHNLIILIFHSL